MKKIVALVLVFWGITGIGYSQEQTNTQNAENINYDKSGNIRYIKFDEENKTAGRNSPSSPDSFWKDLLGVQV